MPQTISIIGTAGRKEDKSKMSAELYYRMVIHALTWISNRYDTRDVTLVSGGAAWADHIAVTSFLHENFEWAGLELHFPAPFEEALFRPDRYKTTGGTANFYHKYFGEKLSGGVDPFHTLNQIQAALDAGATSTVSKGFFQRNLLVGASDILLAYTWGNSHSMPKDGGTLYTWNNSRSPVKAHFPLKEI